MCKRRTKYWGCVHGPFQNFDTNPPKLYALGSTGIVNVLKVTCEDRDEMELTPSQHLKLFLTRLVMFSVIVNVLLSPVGISFTNHLVWLCLSLHRSILRAECWLKASRPSPCSSPPSHCVRTEVISGLSSARCCPHCDFHPQLSPTKRILFICFFVSLPEHFMLQQLLLSPSVIYFPSFQNSLYFSIQTPCPPCALMCLNKISGLDWGKQRCEMLEKLGRKRKEKWFYEQLKGVGDGV